MNSVAPNSAPPSHPPPFISYALNPAPNLSHIPLPATSDANLHHGPTIASAVGYKPVAKTGSSHHKVTATTSNGKDKHKSVFQIRIPWILVMKVSCQKPNTLMADRGGELETTRMLTSMGCFHWLMKSFQLVVMGGSRSVYGMHNGQLTMSNQLIMQKLWKRSLKGYIYHS